MYMNTDEINEELAVMQLSDSFFPTGLYATSNGLEFLFSNNEINGIEDIKNMIKVNIEQQIGPSDCIALSHAFTNAEKKDFKEIIQADEIAFIMKPIEEIRKASVIAQNIATINTCCLKIPCLKTKAFCAPIAKINEIPRIKPVKKEEAIFIKLKVLNFLLINKKLNF